MYSSNIREEEKLISATCTDPANIAYVNGEWKWKNPEFDPEVEGSKEYSKLIIESVRRLVLLKISTPNLKIRAGELSALIKKMEVLSCNSSDVSVIKLSYSKTQIAMPRR